MPKRKSPDFHIKDLLFFNNFEEIGSLFSADSRSASFEIVVNIILNLTMFFKEHAIKYANERLSFEQRSFKFDYVLPGPLKYPQQPKTFPELESAITLLKSYLKIAGWEIFKTLAVLSGNSLHRSPPNSDPKNETVERQFNQLVYGGSTIDIISLQDPAWIKNYFSVPDSQKQALAEKLNIAKQDQDHAVIFGFREIIGRDFTFTGACLFTVSPLTLTNGRIVFSLAIHFPFDVSANDKTKEGTGVRYRPLNWPTDYVRKLLDRLIHELSVSLENIRQSSVIRSFGFQDVFAVPVSRNVDFLLPYRTKADSQKDKGEQIRLFLACLALLEAEGRKRQVRINVDEILEILSFARKNGTFDNRDRRRIMTGISKLSVPSPALDSDFWFKIQELSEKKGYVDLEAGEWYKADGAFAVFPSHLLRAAKGRINRHRLLLVSLWILIESGKNDLTLTCPLKKIFEVVDLAPNQTTWREILAILNVLKDERIILHWECEIQKLTDSLEEALIISLSPFLDPILFPPRQSIFRNEILSVNEIKMILDGSGLSKAKFVKRMGLSPSRFESILKGNVSRESSNIIRGHFGYFLNNSNPNQIPVSGSLFSVTRRKKRSSPPRNNPKNR